MQLLDVLNAHFQVIFGIGKTQSTLLQLAYFVCRISRTDTIGPLIHQVRAHI